MSQTIQISDFPLGKLFHIIESAHQLSTISSQLLLPQGKFEKFRLSTKQDNRYLEGILRYLENVCDILKTFFRISSKILREICKRPN